MRKKDIKQAIDARLASLDVDGGLEQRILKGNRECRRPGIRPGLVFAAACLCVVLVVPALAVAVPEFRKFLGVLKTDVVQLLAPVELSSESNGIRMEVLAAMNDNEAVVAYITMQDMAGGSLNGDIDLYDYSISGLNVFSCLPMESSDPQTALLCILADGGSNINGKNVTLRVDRFLSGRKVLEPFDTGMDLSQLAALQTTSLNALDEVNGGGGQALEDYDQGMEVNVLVPGQQSIALPEVDFAMISGAGMVGEALHIQLLWPEKLKDNEHIDDDGRLYLENAAGERVWSSDKIYFRHGGLAYTESIFPLDDPTAYRLYADGFTTKERMVKGKWQVTFPITAAKEPQIISTDIDLGTVRVSSITFSPLGVTLAGSGTAWPKEMQLALQMKNGEQIALESMVVQTLGNSITRRYRPTGEMLVPEDVEAVLVNGAAYHP